MPQLTTVIAEFFAPLILAFEDRESLILFVRELGWEIELTDDQTRAIEELFGLTATFSEIAALTQDQSDDASAGETTQAVLLLAEAIFNSIKNLASLNAAALAALPRPLGDPSTWSQMALDIPEYLTVTWLNTCAPLLYELLHFCGVVKETPRADDLPPKREIIWQKLTDLIAEPVDSIKSKYAWGSVLRHDELMTNLARLCFAARFFPQLKYVQQDLADLYLPSQHAAGVRQIGLQLYRGRDPKMSLFSELSLVLLPAPKSPSHDDITGLILTNRFKGAGLWTRISKAVGMCLPKPLVS